jgi:hypothetical protein
MQPNVLEEGLSNSLLLLAKVFSPQPPALRMMMRYNQTI